MLREFVSNTLNEIDKLIAKKSVKFYFVLAVVMPILIGFAAVRIQSNDMITLPALSISFFIMNSFLLVVLPLFVFMSSSELFAGEWEKGSLFQVRPVTRMEIYLSKASAIAVLTFMQLVVVWALALITSTVLEKTIIWNEIGSMFISLLVSIVPLAAIVSLATFISQWFKNSPASLASGIFLYGLMAALPFAFPNLLHLFPTAYMDWYQQWLGNVNVLWLVQSFAYLFSFSSLFLTAGYYMFKAKEL
ncbi:ABC transporter permease [Mesobacillus selenatarsenatis]|uniref:Membrane spanning protein n=1 Tax=Mesobacillus selenatarsenatis (strain DSM 18680 / JCM 14380 / FERM P-15431 / SF-1) TaxID=1321606 RepID=A0A0A8XER1_MESS1|nr:ABC transporter permease [Mesobacillus selenatarsenatis]GAM16641.1 membrane spanning protein [Mesobacillus selenatarsenatis SF-1]